jgi:hypothetical protein
VLNLSSQFFPLLESNISEADADQKKTLLAEALKAMEGLKSVMDSAKVVTDKLIAEVRAEMAQYRP